MLLKAKQAVRSKLAAYYAGSHGPIITAATILDPRLKIDYFRDCKWSAKEIEEVREKFASAFDEYKREDDVENALGSSEAATNDVPTSVLKNPFKRCRVDRLSEIDRYLEDPCAAEAPDFDVLAWWKTHEASYPTLAMMARDFFAIPASSVSSERAFSSSGGLISKKRTRLANNTIRAMMCIKEWTRKDFVAPKGGAMVEDAATEPESE